MSPLPKHSTAAIHWMTLIGLVAALFLAGSLLQVRPALSGPGDDDSADDDDSTGDDDSAGDDDDSAGDDDDSVGDDDSPSDSSGSSQSASEAAGDTVGCSCQDSLAAGLDVVPMGALLLVALGMLGVRRRR
jgi:hypothetical protein